MNLEMNSNLEMKTPIKYLNGNELGNENHESNLV